MQLTGAEICKIIKACSEAGVTSLKLGELELHLGEVKQEHHYHLPQKENENEYNYTPLEYSAIMGPQASVPKAESEENETQPQEDQELEDALLMFEDPSEWQRRQLTA
jgi:hypothetical protein